MTHAFFTHEVCLHLKTMTALYKHHQISSTLNNAANFCTMLRESLETLISSFLSNIFMKRMHSTDNNFKSYPGMLGNGCVQLHNPADLTDHLEKVTNAKSVTMQTLRHMANRLLVNILLPETLLSDAKPLILHTSKGIATKCVLLSDNGVVLQTAHRSRLRLKLSLLTYWNTAQPKRPLIYFL